MGLKHPGKVVWAYRQYHLVGIVVRRLPVGRRPEAYAVRSPGVVIETASRTCVEEVKQLPTHLFRNVLQLRKYCFGAGFELGAIAIGWESLILSDCLEVAEAYLENGKT